MLCTSGLLPARAYAVRVPPALIAPCTAPTSPFSTATRPPKLPRTQRPFFFASPSKRTPTPTPSARHASTTTTDAAPSSLGSAATTPPPPLTQLTWNGFLALRRTRRKISVMTSSVSAVATTFTGLRIFIDRGYDSALAASFGLDPLLVAGLSTFGMLAVGWLLGPFFGNAVFNLRYRGMRGEIERKEREFYSRIKRHRVDPTSSSMANPVPDYYGEKIGSVADYRRWMKDQRAFNLKRGAYQGGK